MTKRIRWHVEHETGEAAGYVGTLDSYVFYIWSPEDDATEWLLTADLPGERGERCYGSSASEAKQLAEQLLDRFASSLGAVFGDTIAADLRSRANELEMMVGRNPGEERDCRLVASGLKRAAELIEHGDQPAALEPGTAAVPAAEGEHP